MPFSGSGAASGAAAGSAFGPWGTVIGGVAGGLLGGKKAPKTATLTPVDLQEEQRKAIAGNLNAETDIETLLNRANTFEQDQAISLMEKAMPGYGNLAKKLTGLAGNLATNPYDLPPDVQANLERQAAERGISVGTRGQTQQFSLLRDLGVNQLQYGQSRIGQAQGLTGLLAGISPKVNPMSALSFYVSPAQQAQNRLQQNIAGQEIGQGAYNAETAADNANQQGTWDAIAYGAGGLSGILKGATKNKLSYSPSGSSPSTTGALTT